MVSKGEKRATEGLADGLVKLVEEVDGEVAVKLDPLDQLATIGGQKLLKKYINF